MCNGAINGCGRPHSCEHIGNTGLKTILMFIENHKLKMGLNDAYDIEYRYEAG